MNLNAELPLVSVVMITYQHEHYIIEAIRGILMQEYIGPIELIIANDKSPDQTNSIIENYFHENEIPKNVTVRYTSHEINKGMMENFAWALSQAQGKYIAICEGDDYWIDPQKLQKQVDFLEKNEDYIIHSGKAQVLADGQFAHIIGQSEPQNTYAFPDFYTKNNLITCTVLFRKINELRFFKGVVFADWFLYCNLLSNDPLKNAYVSEEVYAIYRMHDSGVMASLNMGTKSNETFLNQIKNIQQTYDVEYSKEDYIRINGYHYQLFKSYLEQKHFCKAFSILRSNMIMCKTKINIRVYLSILKHWIF